MSADAHPFVITVGSDTDGYYGMEYQVAGRRLGQLELTNDDAVAQWHQRASADDFMTGDVVIINATGAKATVFCQTTHVGGSGRSREGWMIKAGDDLVFVAADEIRIATAQEVGGE